MISHEHVGKMINCVEVDSHEVPRFVLDKRRGGRVYRDTFGKHLGQCAKPLVLLLIDLRCLGDERQDVFGQEFARVKSQFL